MKFPKEYSKNNNLFDTNILGVRNGNHVYIIICYERTVVGI